MLFAGILSLIVGLLMSILYIQFALKKPAKQSQDFLAGFFTFFL